MECVSDTDRLSGKLMIRWERNMVRNRLLLAGQAGRGRGFNGPLRGSCNHWGASRDSWICSNGHWSVGSVGFRSCVGCCNVGWGDCSGLWGRFWGSWWGSRGHLEGSIGSPGDSRSHFGCGSNSQWGGSRGASRDSLGGSTGWWRGCWILGLLRRFCRGSSVNCRT